MRFFQKRWRPRHLLLAWLVYWIGLTLVIMGPAIRAIQRMSQDPNSHGGAAAGFANDVLTMTVTQAGVTTWTGSISFLSLVLLAAGPPLVMWVVWLVGASRTNNAGERAVKEATHRTELHAADPRIGIVDPSNSKRSALEES